MARIRRPYAEGGANNGCNNCHGCRGGAGASLRPD
jgi:hypothetical protein